MYSIRHVEKNGYESISPARSVSLDPASKENRNRPALLAYDEKGECHDAGFGDGIVYVMNENGKTIGVYNLDEMALAASLHPIS